MKRFSEYVSLGHPDKIADYISQYILDRYIEKDPLTRYAVEVQIKDHNVTLGGEVSSSHTFTEYDFMRFVHDAVAEIGYTRDYKNMWGVQNAICAKDLQVCTHISQQSNDIAQGLKGWGDQGIFFGYAAPDESTNYMPIDHHLAKVICKELFDSKIGGLDIKTQVIMEDYKVEKVIVAIPLLDDVTENNTKLQVEYIVQKVVAENNTEWVNENIDITINGTGRYVSHSSIADCGTTGRKLVVDFYGGNCKIGGGSPWTKDGSKADLTLNLYAREIAVAWAKEENVPVIVSIACCIGKSEIDAIVQNAITGEVIVKVDADILPTATVSPKALIEKYNLNTPIFASMCKWGLFGVYQKDKAWEK